MAHSKTFRDAVHGDIELFDHEVRVIHTRAFQRLHDIRQLGIAYAVFPDAVHSRFEHAIGSVHMAQRIIDSVREKPNGARIVTDEHVQILRMAALLHDIGHIPMGHTLEDEIGLIRESHEDTERVNHYFEAIRGELGLHKKEEENTDEGDRDLAKLLNLAETVIAHLHDLHLIEKGKASPLDSTSADADAVSKNPLHNNWFLADAVGNTVCADLLDYILRDNYFTGLKKHFDARIFRAFDVATRNGKNRLVVNLLKRKFRMDLLSELIEILRMRYTLGETVYYHHAKVSGGAMVARALMFLFRGIEEHDTEKPDSPIRPLLWEKILMGGDERLMDLTEEYARQIGGTRGAAAVEIMRKVRSRRFFKAIYRVRPGGDVAQRMHARYGAVDAQDKLIELVRGEKVEAHEMAIYCPRETMALKASDVLVVWDTSGEPERLSQLAKETMVLGAFPRSVADEVVALEAKYPALWNMYVFIDESKMEEAYGINEHLRLVLGENDPLLVAALEERLDYQRGKTEFLKTQKGIEKVLARFRPAYEEAQRRRFAQGEQTKLLSDESQSRLEEQDLLEAFAAAIAELRRENRNNPE